MEEKRISQELNGAGASPEIIAAEIIALTKDVLHWSNETNEVCMNDRYY
jgi:hypothetical protein